ncbi:MAG: hypothetical protein GJU76_13735 [Gallionella sp.]|jgi:hypothetical protein|nr:hypothetical protein [Gallionella sp.]
MRTTGKRQSDLLLLDAVDIFNADGIPYAVVGGFAAAVHGVDRGTKDMDVILQIALPELPLLASRLKEAGFATTLRRGGFDDPIAAVIELKDVHQNCVEILVGIKGLPDDAFSRAIEIAYCGSTLRVVGYEDFLAMKLSAGGPKDLLDVDEALKVNPNFDVELLRRLIQGYGKEATRRFEQGVARLQRLETCSDGPSGYSC